MKSFPSILQLPHHIAVTTETTCPTRWLIGGDEVTFDWYLDSGIEMSRPV